MESWRIKTIFDNRSQRILPDAGAGLGATVVRSERGIGHPVYFGQGETQKMLNLFGAPKTSNPELLEAIEYNKSYPMWMVSPTHLGRNGGAVIGESGTETLGAGVDHMPNKNLSELKLYRRLEQEGAEFAEETKFGGELLKDEYDDPVYLKIYVDGEDIEADISESPAGTWTFTKGGVLESGAFDTGANTINLEFTEAYMASNNPEVVELVYVVDLSDYYALLTTVGPADDAYLQVQLSEIELEVAGVTTKAFEMRVFRKNIRGKFKEDVDSPIIFSLGEDDVDGYGTPIYADNVFENSNSFIVYVNTDKAYGTFADDTSPVSLYGGSRGGVVTSLDLTSAYNYFKEVRKYPIDLFFDATVDEGVAMKFETLRGAFNKYARYILPLPNKDPIQTLDDNPVASLPQDRGISYYWGWFKLRNIYHTSGSLIGIPMGEIAKKHADIMLLGFGGLAPAWFDENGMGGQLTGGRIIEALYDPTEDQLKSMDEHRINPVVFDPTHGPMIMSRRTSEGGAISDWSFIDYSGAMDYIIKNTVTQVLPFQVVKMNDPAHRNIVRTKLETLVSPMTVPPLNVVDSFAVKCDGENNNAEVRSREEFRVDLAVKFTPKSRTIVFTFINTPQGANVEEMFN